MWERPPSAVQSGEAGNLPEVTPVMVAHSAPEWNTSVSLVNMRITTCHVIALMSAFLLATLSISALHAQTAPPVDPKTVPVIDAGLGTCSADFTVKDAAGAPVYNAKISVHIAYGFMNLHKLDLEVGTNAAGQARFTGLPDKIKQGLFFQASEGGREASVFDNPALTCKKEFTVTLEKKSH
jgi:hypothetical protein